MEPAIGRFTSVDPLAEKYYSWSPYVGNNSIRRVDPNGEDWRDKVVGVAIGLFTNAIHGSSSLRDMYLQIAQETIIIHCCKLISFHWLLVLE